MRSDEKTVDRDERKLSRVFSDQNPVTRRERDANLDSREFPPFLRNGARNYFRTGKGRGIITSRENLRAALSRRGPRPPFAARRRNSEYVTGVNLSPDTGVGKGGSVYPFPRVHTCAGCAARCVWRWEERAERFMNGMFPRQVLL